MEKVKPHVLTRWLAALRSGEYKQAQAQLRSAADGFADYGFCCLGVLADLYAKDQGDSEAFWEQHNHDSMPPDEVLDWALENPLPSEWNGEPDKNWDTSIPDQAIPESTLSLVELNDGFSVPTGEHLEFDEEGYREERFDFLQIADVIEREQAEL